MTQTALPLVFFLQMAVLLGACRVVGWAAKHELVGEMLGVSFQGMSLVVSASFFHNCQKADFPQESLDIRRNWR